MGRVPLCPTGNGGERAKGKSECLCVSQTVDHDAHHHSLLFGPRRVVGSSAKSGPTSGPFTAKESPQGRMRKILGAVVIRIAVRSTPSFSGAGNSVRSTLYWMRLGRGSETFWAVQMGVDPPGSPEVWESLRIGLSLVLSSLSLTNPRWSLAPHRVPTRHHIHKRRNGTEYGVLYIPSEKYERSGGKEIVDHENDQGFFLSLFLSSV